MGLIYYITQVQFDFGAIALARSECERAGIRRPLVCTDRGGVALANSIRDLNRRLGLPSGLGAMGIGPELHEDVATHALKDHCHATNPRIASQANYVAMLAAAA